MQPGFSRATMVSILFFGVGAVIVMLLRAIFGFEPYWDLGLGIVLAAFLSAYGFLWGVGAFSPEMNVHVDENTPQPTMEEREAEIGFLGILSNSIWTISFATLIVVVVLFGIAFIPGGPALNVTSVEEASIHGAGTFLFTIGEQEYAVNQIVVFVGFVIFTIVSLGIGAAILAAITWGVSSGVAEAKEMEAASQMPAPEQPGRLSKGASRVAGSLAGAIAPKPRENESTAIVAKDPLLEQQKEA